MLVFIAAGGIAVGAISLGTIRCWRWTILFNLLLPALFFAAAYVLMPVEQAFQFDNDEGIELALASLYTQGFEFYRDIWRDQPPLFSLLLVQWQHWFGASVVAGRLLVLSFATLLVWAFAQTLRCFLSPAIALLGALMLANSINFLRLSVSVMMGLPSIALAMLAVYATARFCQGCQAKAGGWLWLALSAAALAASLQIKVFTAFLAPILLGYIALASWQRVKPGWRRAIAPLLWLLVLAIAFSAINQAIGFDRAAELAQFQFQGNLKAAFVRENSLFDLAAMYLQELDYVLLGTIGAIALARQPEGLPRLPLLWLLLATALMLNHKPLWYHHYLLLSLPLTWLAACGVQVAADRLRATGWRWRPHRAEFQAREQRLAAWATLALLFACSVAPVKLAATQLQNRATLQASAAQRAVAAEIVQYKADTHWLFADMPMYAIATGINLPPPIAAVSRKRIATGEVSLAFLEEIIREYQPEQFAIARFPEIREPLRPYLAAHYRELPLQAGTHHFVRNDLWLAKHGEGGIRTLDGA